MKKLYTDASYSWQNTEVIATGKICIADDDGFVRVEKVAIGKVENLKQYINIFELIAIARAIEISIEQGWKDNLAIYTDSRTAQSWASKGVNAKLTSLAHRNADTYIKTARSNYGGIVTFYFLPRDMNKAGLILEEELLKSKSVALDTPIIRTGIELDNFPTP